MKIQVLRVDGNVEVINLVGTVTAHEPGGDLPYPRNQSPIHVEETGADYFFREDGRYDGWGMSVNVPAKDGEGLGLPQEAKDFISAVEADREIIRPTQEDTPKPIRSTPDRKGRYALAHPTPGGYAFWAINDMEAMKNWLAVPADFPNAEQVIRFAWEQIQL
jgi:hypothetical protein